MAQHDQNIANGTGAAVRSDINDMGAALFSQSSGTSAPSPTVAHQVWADTTNNLLKKRNAANSGWIVIRTLDEAFAVSRSSNTVLGISDVGKTFIATSTFTQTLTAAATLGDGWFCDYYNDGSGNITLDPNSSEQINGSTTLVLKPGDGGRITCNGSSFKYIGIGASIGTGSLLRATSPDITTPNIIGITGGTSAAAGSVGEVIESSVNQGSATSLTTITAKTITSITLTAGKWRIDANALYSGGATTTVQMTCASISTSTNTFTSSEDRAVSNFYNGEAVFNATNNPATFIGGPLPTLEVNITSTTTYYLVGFAKFATSTMAAFGKLRGVRIQG